MKLIAEKNPENSLTILKEDPIPIWIDEYVLQKVND